jgi:hypothetical protein
MRHASLCIVILICFAGCSSGSASSGGAGSDADVDSGTHANGDGGGADASIDAAHEAETPDAGHASCAEFCARAASANCPGQSQCASGCANLVAATPADCKTEVQALLDCGATMGTFGCDGSGLPMLAGGCDGPATAWLSCQQGDAGIPEGGADDTGTGTCNDNFTSGNQTCDSCFNAACCPQLMTCAGDGICTSNVVCAMFCNGDATCENNCLQQDANSYPSSAAAANAAFGCMRTSCGAICGY